MVRLMVKIGQSLYRTVSIGAVMLIACILCHLPCFGQHFEITQQNDSLWTLTLNKDGVITDSWQLPYPVYRFATADINGDGSLNAVVGVYKSSRYFKQPSRRVFIFKDFDGDIRPLWLGSRLGGELVDFTVKDNKVRAIEVGNEGYVVSDYVWTGFGLGFDELIATCPTINQCYNFFN